MYMNLKAKKTYKNTYAVLIQWRWRVKYGIVLTFKCYKTYKVLKSSFKLSTHFIKICKRCHIDAISTYIAFDINISHIYNMLCTNNWTVREPAVVGIHVEDNTCDKIHVGRDKNKSKKWCFCSGCPERFDLCCVHCWSSL